MQFELNENQYELYKEFMGERNLEELAATLTGECDELDCFTYGLTNEQWREAALQAYTDKLVDKVES